MIFCFTIPNYGNPELGEFPTRYMLYNSTVTIFTYRLMLDRLKKKSWLQLKPENYQGFLQIY